MQPAATLIRLVYVPVLAMDLVLDHVYRFLLSFPHRDLCFDWVCVLSKRICRNYISVTRDI